MAEPYVKLYGSNMIELSNGNVNIMFRRDAKNTYYWTLEEGYEFVSYGVESYDKYTFIPDKDYPNQIGLEDRNGWSILEAEIEEDYFEWINRVKARKGGDEVDINLEKHLYGSSSALIDFLESYKFSIRFWDESDI